MPKLGRGAWGDSEKGESSREPLAAGGKKKKGFSTWTEPGEGVKKNQSETADRRRSRGMMRDTGKGSGVNRAKKELGRLSSSVKKIGFATKGREYGGSADRPRGAPGVFSTRPVISFTRKKFERTEREGRGEGGPSGGRGGEGIPFLEVSSALRGGGGAIFVRLPSEKEEKKGRPRVFREKKRHPCAPKYGIFPYHKKEEGGFQLQERKKEHHER